jgi:pimeloyl-ACP methyl ester carboxylesterase
MLLLTLLVGVAAAQQTAPPDNFFDAGGVNIRYIEKGEGEPLLLIHGFSVNTEFQWGGNLNRLAENYRVVALDARGHGKSDKPHGPEHYGALMADDCIRLLDHLDIDRAHVMGYSMGGAIVLNLVARYPDRLLSAVVGGNGWARPGDEMEGFIEVLAQGLENGEGIKPLLLALTPAGQEPMPEQQLNQMNAMAMAVNDPLALASVARSFPGFQVSREALESNRVPTTIIIGSVDPLYQLVPPAREVMSNLSVVVLEGDNHMTAPRNPAFYDAALAHFEANGIGADAAPVTAGIGAAQPALSAR